MRIGALVCKLTRKHKEARFEFQGCKPSPLGGGRFGEPGIPVYKVSCPRCGVSFLMGEDEFAKGLAEAIEKQGRYKGLKVIQYTSGYKPLTFDAWQDRS